MKPPRPLLVGLEEKTSRARIQWHAVKLYLEAVRRLDDRPLHDLRDTVLPAYPQDAPIPAQFVFYLATTGHPVVTPLRAAFVAWCDRWHLYGGAADTARRTLQEWATHGAPDPLQWAHPPDPEAERYDPEDGAITFTDPGWIPGTGEDWESARARIVRRFEWQIEAQRARLLGEAHYRHEAPRKNAKHGRNSAPAERHFEMLVRWNVSRWTYSRIEKEWGRTRSTVVEALQEASALTGIPCRVGRPGRPPGNTGAA